MSSSNLLKLYNTLTRKKQIFKPIKSKNVPRQRSGQVGIYTCGPTVYDFAHIGNLRTFIFEDILRRSLKYNGYKIKQAMNITDIDDKIIKKAEAENKPIGAITKFYTKFFLNDIKKLNIEKAEVYPKATAHIKEMIAMIKILLKNGFAYKGEDGSIYFDISKFKTYGKLSKLEKRELKTGARISADEYKKEEAQDFALWKAKKAGEPFWPASFGAGRPGWHIECSAMSAKHLGKTFDIHAGGVDLIFPHHENEIAQSEAAHGKKFANYWLHGEHLLVNNEKMSKSLGNIFTLREIEEKGFNPFAYRYLVLTTHYRSKMNFTWESLQAAANALNNLNNELRIMNYELPAKQKIKINNDKNLINYKKQFLFAINDDLNTPKTLAVVWEIIKNKNLSNKIKKALILEFDKVLGLNLNKIKPVKIQKIPLKIKQMADERELLRQNKQFIPADLLRKKIEQLGYIVEDTAFGPKVQKNF
ncbi:cysteine--tRNA ligase [Candidatus Wolfebacteria bacterium]|nr:cysteine--tRNA ligase [Candidatus Wolfebacteria bacterium]